jgi:hypothetical protein
MLELMQYKPGAGQYQVTLATSFMCYRLAKLLFLLIDVPVYSYKPKKTNPDEEYSHSTKESKNTTPELTYAD